MNSNTKIILLFYTLFLYKKPALVTSKFQRLGSWILDFYDFFFNLFFIFLFSWFFLILLITCYLLSFNSMGFFCWFLVIFFHFFLFSWFLIFFSIYIKNEKCPKLKCPKLKCPKFFVFNVFFILFIFVNLLITFYLFLKFFWVIYPSTS